MTAPAASVPQAAPPTDEAGLRSTAAVALATGAGNALVYVLYAVLSRVFSTDDYGAFTAVAGVAFVAAVPALAVQAVVARHVAVGRLESPGGRAELAVLLRWAWWLGAALFAVSLVAAPAVVAFLHLDDVGPALAMAAWLWRLTVVGAYLGVLQGAGRLRAFARLFVLFAVLRLALGAVGGILGEATGLGVTGAFAGLVASGALTVAIGRRLVGIGPGDAAAARSRTALGREVAAAAHGLLGVVVLCSLDLVLARHYLSAHDSGLYAAGSIIAKGAFFLPQFVAYAGFRQFTDAAHHASAVRRGLLTVVALGAAMTVAAVVLADPVIRVASGERYVAVAHRLWLFAALGAVLALVQLVVYVGIARRRNRLTATLWIAALTETAVIAAAHGSITEIVLSALAVAGALALIGVFLILRTLRPVIAAA
jgi:O-antigen/teichoic acid export membrane protein